VRVFEHKKTIFDQEREWRRKKFEREAESDRIRKLAEIQTPPTAPTSSFPPQEQVRSPANQEGLPSEREKLITARKQILGEYKAACGSVSNRSIYNARNSGIYKPQFSKWVNGLLPDSSATTINFERFLREKKQPIPRKPKL
jgi:hypothetical protein